jgi:tRNA(His) 5'-end guanylyltransferase
MKGYEGVWSQVLPPRTPVIIRVDGKAFHTATKGLNKPFDSRVSLAMWSATLALLKELQNAHIAYTQSDEISILLLNYVNPLTQSWFGNKVQKMVSVAASIATKEFTSSVYYAEELRYRNWLFDARAFSLPKDEVANYFIWRQKDAVRNSISALARKHFSHKEMQGKSSRELVEMLDKVGQSWLHILQPHERLGKLWIKKVETDAEPYTVQSQDFVKIRGLFDDYANIDLFSTEGQLKKPEEDLLTSSSS